MSFDVDYLIPEPQSKKVQNMAIDDGFLPEGALTKPKRTRTKKQSSEAALYEANKLLPEANIYRERREIVIPRDISSINRIGAECGKGVADISGVLLDRVKVADAGDVGKGISDILSLTQKVDFGSLNPEQRGVMARLRNIFTDTKVKVLSEFQTVTEQMNDVVKELETGINRMHGDTDWLIQHIQANNEYLDDMEDIQASLSKAIEEETAKLTEMQRDPNVRTNAIFDQSNIVDALEKRLDKIMRFVHLAKLTDPQLKSMLVVNQSNIEKFEGIRTDMIPTWQSRLSMELLSLQQSRDNDLSKAYDETANRIIVETAKTVGNNMKEAARAANRSTVEIETLRSVQTNIVGSLQEVIKINKEARIAREKGMAELRKMNDELDSSMRGIAHQATESRIRR